MPSAAPWRSGRPTGPACGRWPAWAGATPRPDQERDWGRCPRSLEHVQGGVVELAYRDRWGFQLQRLIRWGRVGCAVSRCHDGTDVSGLEAPGAGGAPQGRHQRNQAPAGLQGQDLGQLAGQPGGSAVAAALRKRSATSPIPRETDLSCGLGPDCPHRPPGRAWGGAHPGSSPPAPSTHAGSAPGHPARSPPPGAAALRYASLPGTGISLGAARTPGRGGPVTA